MYTRSFSVAYSIALVLLCLRCAQAPPSAPSSSIDLYDLSALEGAIHQIVNKERTQKNLPSLNWNDQLSKIARDHSADMLEREYFSHNTPEGLSPAHRADAAGFDCIIVNEGSQRIGIGENILTTYSFDSYEIRESNDQEVIKYNWKSQETLAQEVVSTWMKSRGHRRNILSPDYIQQGIGAVVGEDQKIFVTQNLC